MTVGAGPRRSRGDYPSCGRCRFDLTGSLGKSDTCPECGTSVGVAGVRPVRLRSRSFPGPIGIIVALIAVIALWFYVFAG